MTLDIDLHVPADRRALGELFALMLDSLHLQTEQASLRQILHRPELLSGQVITFRSADNADLVDVIVVPRSEFDDLFRAATLLEIPPAVIHVASIHDLRQMKAELGRPIDQADIVLIDQYLDILDHLRDPGTQLS